MKEKGLLLSVLVIGLASLALTSGSYSLFSDTAQVSSVYRNGTLVLRVDDQKSVEFSFDGIAPGDTREFSVILKNVGVIQQQVDLDIAWDVAESAEGLAKMYSVVAIHYDGQDVLIPLLAQDPNGDGKIDLTELDQLAVKDLMNPGSVGAPLHIAIGLSEDAGNEFQGQSVTLVTRLQLAQKNAPDISP